VLLTAPPCLCPLLCVCHPFHCVRRYFPEPDLPELEITEQQIEHVKVGAGWFHLEKGRQKCGKKCFRSRRCTALLELANLMRLQAFCNVYTASPNSSCGCYTL
jgi:hypothetical protein